MPRTSGRRAAQTSRLGPPRDSQAKNSSSRPRLKVKELCAGCIVWLPPKVDNDESIKCIRKEVCCNGKNLDIDGYNHPVVILMVGPTSCFVAQVRSEAFLLIMINSHCFSRKEKGGFKLMQLPAGHFQKTKTTKCHETYRDIPNASR